MKEECDHIRFYDDEYETCPKCGDYLRPIREPQWLCSDCGCWFSFNIDGIDGCPKCGSHSIDKRGEE